MSNKDIIVPDTRNIIDDNFFAKNSCLGGLSNTPLSNSKNIENNVCIDYLKMRLDATFSPDMSCYKKLLDALRVPCDVYDTDKKVKNYKKCWIFDANVFIYTGGETTKSRLGIDTTIIELKGQACREFEGRGGDWVELFTVLMEYGASCIRIDIALDDFKNTCPISSLIYKINKHFYVSDWKRSPEIEFSHNGGATITFGKKSKKVLCIYNKAAERLGKGIDVFCKDWVRFESRFNDETGEGAFLNVYQGLTNNNLDVVAKQLLKGLIDFKKDNKETRHNLFRVETWNKWELLCDVDSRIKIRNQYKLETSITQKINWLGRSATKNRMLLELCCPNIYHDVDGYFVYDHIPKLKNREIAMINYLRVQNGLNRITLEEAQTFLEIIIFAILNLMKPFYL